MAPREGRAPEFGYCTLPPLVLLTFIWEVSFHHHHHHNQPRPPPCYTATDAGARNEPSINQDNIRRARAASDPESERAGGPEQAKRRCQPHRCQCHLAPSRRPPSLSHTLIRSGNVRAASGGENKKTLGSIYNIVKT